MLIRVKFEKKIYKINTQSICVSCPPWQAKQKARTAAGKGEQRQRGAGGRLVAQKEVLRLLV